MNVKAPLVRKAEAKRSEPPAELPTQMAGFEVVDNKGPQTFSEGFSDNTKQPSVKQELSMDLENSYFEDKFAKAPPVVNQNLNKQEKNIPAESNQVIKPKPESVIKQNQTSPTKKDAGGPPSNLPI